MTAPRTALTVLLALGAVVLAGIEGWFNLHSDDTGILAMSLLLVSAAYGARLGPRWAWLAGGFFAASIPVSALVSVAFNIHAPFSGPPTAPAVILPLVFALVGAYLGAGLRSLARD